MFRQKGTKICDVCRECHLQRERQKAYYEGREDGRKDLLSKIKELYNIKEQE